MSAVTSGLTAAIALATMMMIVVVIAVGRTGCWRTMMMSDRNGSVEGAETVVRDMVPFLREMAGIWEQTDGNLADCLADAADEIERLRGHEVLLRGVIDQQMEEIARLQIMGNLVATAAENAAQGSDFRWKPDQWKAVNSALNDALVMWKEARRG